jgi:hypothetical protein
VTRAARGAVLVAALLLAVAPAGDRYTMRQRRLCYCDTKGYPTRLSLDPVPMAIDDEVTWETSLVAPIPP